MTENAKKWIAALRSGEFRQAQRRLRSFDAYCCLGVACELAKREGVIEEYDDAATGLPAEVMAWLGLADDEGRFQTENRFGCETLSRLNDTGHSFTYIAGVIESEPKDLFAEPKSPALPEKP